MRTVNVPASLEYNVHIESGLIDKCGEYAEKLCKGRRAVVISDSNVAPLYADRVVKSLENSGFEASTFVIEAGEASKNPDNLVGAANFCIESSLTRSDVIIALGGGVITDLGGLCAAMYQRGINLVQMPTSLLAMVDSSVGGKTAVNLSKGKNMFGVFYQPSAVLCDPETLKTLPGEEFSNGMAEVIKYAVLRGGVLCQLIENDDISTSMDEVIEECVKIKRDYVSADEFDKGERQFLNLGHTVGHAIERSSGLSIAHGSAVATGMCIVARACESEGILSGEDVEYIENMCAKYHLPTKSRIDAEKLFDASLSDKKRAGDNVTLVMIKSVGECFLKKSPVSYLRRVIELGIGGKR